MGRGPAGRERGRRWPAWAAGAVTATTTACGGDPWSPIPDPVTREGGKMFDLWRFSNIAGLLVALLIWGLVAYCVLRFRRRGDADLPRQTHANVPMEVLYTVAPVVVVAVLFWFTVAVENDVTDVSGDPDLVVDVTGFQWQWQFRYAESGVVVTGVPGDPPVLMLPAGEVVRFRLTTSDVIHSFYVPKFLTKRDAIPGIDNAFDVVVNEPGTWVGRCAEYCGLDHYKMNFTVRAVPAAEFDAWLSAEQAAP